MSGPGNPAYQEYLRNSILSASSEQLHLMLLDGALRFCARAKDAMAGRDFEGSYVSLDRAQRIVLELDAGLNPQHNPGLVEQMRALYTFVYARLVEANLHRDAQAVSDAERILTSQRQTWQIIVDKIQSEVRAPAALAATRGAAGSDAGPESGFVAEG